MPSRQIIAAGKVAIELMSAFHPLQKFADADPNKRTRYHYTPGSGPGGEERIALIA
jgi:hypothetical protein